MQDGTGVEKHEEKAYEKSDEQQEYIEQANNNTEQGNTPPVKDGKGLTMMARSADEGDDDNDDGDPYTEIEVGDDSDETKKKIPVM